MQPTAGRRRRVVPLLHVEPLAGHARDLREPGFALKLLAISGSLQQNSTNTAVLEIARARSAPGVDVSLFDGLDRIAPFNPDVEPAPPEVEAFRALVRSADGILVATPEYAHGMPGALKNALDWLVGSGDLYGKRAVVVSAAPSPDRAEHARADLERTLRAQGAQVLSSFTIAVPAAARGHERDDAGIVAAVDRAVRIFADRID